MKTADSVLVMRVELTKTTVTVAAGANLRARYQAET